MAFATSASYVDGKGSAVPERWTAITGQIVKIIDLVITMLLS